RAPRFRNDHTQGLPQALTNFSQHAVHSIRVGIIKEIRRELISGHVAQGVSYELRTQSRTANAYQQQVLERACGSSYASIMHLRGSGFYGSNRRVDLFATLFRCVKGSIEQPVMP